MDEQRYTMTEVERATGIKHNTIGYRLRKLGIKYDMRRGMTYEDVKAVVNYRPLRPGMQPARKSAIDNLRMKLKNDGFKTT